MSAAADKRTPRRASKARIGTLILGIVVPVGVAALAPPLFVLLAVGLMPSIVAAVVDRHPRRLLALAVAAMNLSGLAIPTIELYKGDGTLAMAQHVLMEGGNWLIMYGAAAMGWAINWAMPAVARFFIELRAESAEQALRKRAAMLVEEWGREVGEGG